jgi:hypothetical protein
MVIAGTTAAWAAGPSADRLGQAALRDGAAIASKKQWSLNSECLCGLNETNKKF